ncbi:hypothetical protein [Roseomonas chloroacetimidivorans]|uniref:hypothetical protein n=1 Tax=Roseomonas chloroacetimidivorans TaxID=1766656 RepID=UPI003C79012E
MTSSTAGSALPQSDDDSAMRLMVLEMTIAAIAARLPPDDLEEIASLLVFIAKGSDAASDLTGLSGRAPSLNSAGYFATEMLERIARSRKPKRDADERGSVARTRKRPS